MNEKTFLDRLHARARGELAPEECLLLEREIAADAGLGALARDYELVFALTRAESGSPVARTRFEQLEPRLARPSWLRPVAAAAVLLAVAALSFLAGRRSGSGAEPLYLRTIELNPRTAAAALPVDLPADLGAFDPRGPGGVSFLHDLDEAEEMARLAERPLLVYGAYPDCPLAAALDARVFSDPGVIELSERTVPVRVNLADLSADEQRSYLARGYPFLEVWRDDGRTAHSLSRRPDPVTFLESLHDGLEKSDAVGEQPAWSELNSFAACFGVARAAELAGDIAAAERGFRALLEDPSAPPWVSERSRSGLARLSRCALDLLLEARTAAASDPAAARELLRDACKRLAGSSFAPDLEAALERLEHDGRFPRLAEADHSA